jgi:Arc/MetJ family transcription regulator
MKTTIDIQDELIARAKRYAQRTGRPLRAVVEDGLRRVLSDSTRNTSYKLPDRSVGDPDAKDPLETLSWQDLREEIYGKPQVR